MHEVPQAAALSSVSMERTELTPPERRLWDAYPKGDKVDFGPGAPEDGASWGPERTLRAKVIRALLLGDVTPASALRVAGARITGVLDLRNADLTCPVVLHSCHFEKTPLFYAARTRQLAFTRSVLPNLVATEITTSGALQLSECRIAGSVRLIGAELGALSLDNAVLGTEDTDVEVLQLNPGHIVNDLYAPGLVASGRLALKGARVGGVVDLTAATLTGSADFRRARFDELCATPDAWPGKVKLDGLTFGALTPRLPAAARLELLTRDEEGHVPHAYEQLAAEYARIGDDTSARTVRLAKQRRYRATLPGYARIWGYLQDITVGYGYRPMRAAAWLVVLLVLGGVVFGLHHPPPADPAKGPAFNPLVYPLDLVLPVVDFGQAKAFTPQGWYQWLSYLLIAAGWLLATTVVAGITRTVNRQ